MKFFMVAPQHITPAKFFQPVFPAVASQAGNIPRPRAVFFRHYHPYLPHIAMDETPEH
jgi:hypothetical protein